MQSPCRCSASVRHRPSTFCAYFSRASASARSEGQKARRERPIAADADTLGVSWRRRPGGRRRTDRVRRTAGAYMANLPRRKAKPRPASLSAERRCAIKRAFSDSPVGFQTSFPVGLKTSSGAFEGGRRNLCVIMLCSCCVTLDRAPEAEPHLLDDKPCSKLQPSSPHSQPFSVCVCVWVWVWQTLFGENSGI